METKRSALMIWTNSMQLGFIHSTTKNVLGVILSGSPYSVYDSDAPHVDPTVFELGVPVLGICYGLQEMAWNMKGKVAKCDHREYGFAQLQLGKGDNVDKLFEALGEEMQVLLTWPFRTYLIHGNDHFPGLDVSRRPTFGTTSRFPHCREDTNRSLCRHCPQLQAILGNPIPPGGHTLTHG